LPTAPGTLARVADAPTNVWEAECLPAENEWGSGVRGVRMLERPRGARLTDGEPVLRLAVR
jgi:hypothetical protein